MKNKLGKVVRAMLLTLTLILMCSINASAASGQASIGKKNYSTVQKALSAVKNGQTIKLNRNVTLKSTLVSKKKVTYTFDLNRHKIISKVPDVSKGSFDIRAGKVTLANGTLTGPVLVQEKAALTIKSGTYEQIANAGKTTVINGNVVSKKHPTLCNYGGSLLIKKANVKSVSNCVYAVEGTVTINGGTYRNYNDSASYPIIYSKNATMNLKGGKYVHSYCREFVPAIVYNEKGKVTISGGYYGGTCASINNQATMIIKGGTFFSENSNILWCGANSTTVITGGKFTGGVATSIIGVEEGRKKFSMTGGTVQPYNVLSVICCYGDKKNVTFDKKKVKIIGKCNGYVSVY